MNKNVGTIDEYPLGERIRYLRKKRGLTQKDLANKCGITQGGLAQIEKSQTLPSIQTLRRISDILRVHIAILFATDDVFVLDVETLRARYKKGNELTPSLRRAIKEIVEYSKTLDFN